MISWSHTPFLNRVLFHKQKLHLPQLVELFTAKIEFPAESSIARSYDRHKLGLFSVKENDRKNRDFRPTIFATVSTNFWILSSRSVSIRPNLDAKPSDFRKFENKNIEKSAAKPENSNFVDFFRRRTKYYYYL